MNHTNSTTTQPIDVVVIAVPVGASCLLIVVIVVSLVCLRRRRRRKREATPLPSARDEALEENAYPKTHNSMSNLTNERSRNAENPGDFRPSAVTTPNPKPKLRTGNYENVSPGGGPPTTDVRNTDTRSSKSESKSESESESDTPDYENNPDNVAKVAAAARARLEKRREAPAPTLAAESSHAAVGAHPATAARQARTLDAKANASPGMVMARWGSQEGRLELCEHEPPSPPPTTTTKSRVKTASPSKSLEDLVHRSVPQPPSLPSSFNEKKPGPVAAKPPPKPHVVKARGYVNQPVH